MVSDTADDAAQAQEDAALDINAEAGTAAAEVCALSDSLYVEPHR